MLNNSLSQYNEAITGCDILKNCKLKLCLSTNTLTGGNVSVDFKDTLNSDADKLNPEQD